MRGETLLVAKARADRGTIHNVPVLMLVAAVVILAGVVVVASGRGGEIAPEHPDYPPIDLGPGHRRRCRVAAPAVRCVGL